MAAGASAIALHEHARAMAAVARQRVLPEGDVLAHLRMGKVRWFEP
jgi:hypothetical protein